MQASYADNARHYGFYIDGDIAKLPGGGRRGAAVLCELIPGELVEDPDPHQPTPAPGAGGYRDGWTTINVLDLDLDYDYNDNYDALAAHARLGQETTPGETDWEYDPETGESGYDDGNYPSYPQGRR